MTNNEAINIILEHNDAYVYTKEYMDKYNEAIGMAIKALQESKTGHWIFIENWYDVGRRIKCSECEQVFVIGDRVPSNYCSNCGAKMVEPQESEG